MRWLATVTYRTDSGSLDVPMDFDEIGDLEEMIERGPHFGSIEQILIRYAFADETLTVEGAEEL